MRTPFLIKGGCNDEFSMPPPRLLRFTRWVHTTTLFYAPPLGKSWLRACLDIHTFSNHLGTVLYCKICCGNFPPHPPSCIFLSSWYNTKNGSEVGSFSMVDCSKTLLFFIKIYDINQDIHLEKKQNIWYKIWRRVSVSPKLNIWIIQDLEKSICLP